MRTVLMAAAVTAAFFGASSTALAQNQREQAVRNDRQNLEADQSWIYDDLELAMADAKAQQKPIMVLIRCLP